MEKNNKLKILSILGGAKQGGAEKFFEILSGKNLDQLIKKSQFT